MEVIKKATSAPALVYTTKWLSISKEVYQLHNIGKKSDGCCHRHTFSWVEGAEGKKSTHNLGIP
jgi:hypothetical protein